MARKGNIPTKNKSGITISKHIEEEKKIKTISLFLISMFL